MLDFSKKYNDRRYSVRNIISTSWQFISPRSFKIHARSTKLKRITFELTSAHGHQSKGVSVVCAVKPIVVTITIAFVVAVAVVVRGETGQCGGQERGGGR